MRWLFLFVLMVNAAYVSWEFTRIGSDEPVHKVGATVPPILLLSELDPVVVPVSPLAGEMTAATAEKTSTVLEVAEVVTEPVVNATATDACFTLGPFRKLETLRAYTRAMKDYVADASFRSRDEQEQSMFWVYLTPRADLGKARALGARLEKMDIRDYYIINKGDQINGISLGHFKEKDRAYSYAESIKQLGFQPTIEPVFRTYTIYWLDYRVTPGLAMPEAIFEQLPASNVKRLDRACN